MTINFIDLQSQYRSYQNEINAEIEEVLASSNFIMGEKVKKLEKELASFVGCRHAIACSSGTDAIILALMSIGIKPGDEVITTPFTFIATAEAVAFLGAIPVFVDIDEKTYNIDPSKVEERVSRKTKALMPVSLFGQTADMDEINSIAQKYDLKVIEDAAQSFGAEYKGKRSCGLSDVACTSFFPAKPLGCYGDGGAVFTNDDELAIKIRILLNHGQTKQYIHSHIGINGRLDAIQAGILSVKLRYYNGEIEKRQEVAKTYSDHLTTVITPYIKDENRSVWAQYCIRTTYRDELREKCTKRGVPTAIYYPVPLHLQEVFQYLGYQNGDFPVAEYISGDIMALPMSAFLSNTDQSSTIEVING